MPLLSESGERGKVLSESSAHDINVQSGEQNIPQRVENLEERADNVENSFDRLERRMERYSNFILGITAIVATGFVITSILIGLDYFNNNEQRFEKFLNKTEDFYTKSEVDQKISNFKDCIRLSGLSHCLR